MQFQSASYGHMYYSAAGGAQGRSTTSPRNVAQLGLKLYRRISETEREEVGDHPAAELMREPNPWTSQRAFISDVFGDFLVYDNGYVLKVQPDPGGKLYLLPVPASAVAVLGNGV